MEHIKDQLQNLINEIDKQIEARERDYGFRPKEWQEADQGKSFKEQTDKLELFCDILDVALRSIT